MDKHVALGTGNSRGTGQAGATAFADPVVFHCADSASNHTDAVLNIGGDVYS